MAYRATVLRSESPSAIKLTPGQHPVDHPGRFPGCQHQRPFIRVVGGFAVFADVERFKFRVAHTNPAMSRRIVIGVTSRLSLSSLVGTDSPRFCKVSISRTWRSVFNST